MKPRGHDSGQTRRLSVDIADNATLATLCGERDRNLRWLEQRFGVQISARGQSLRLVGPTQLVEQILDLLQTLRQRVERGGFVDSEVMERLIERMGGLSAPSQSAGQDLGIRGRMVAPRTANQRLYVDAMHNNSVVFGCGPAGTGKTFLAVACAVAALQRHDVRRIVLTRPAVEAGERLGFLPGD
ncbi:MAG: hypothetical protein CMH53_07775, partial [Myxococcales bacterium]|nr:hypothetical protein [Myxococcales bacterium]